MLGWSFYFICSEKNHQMNERTSVNVSKVDYALTFCSKLLNAKVIMTAQKGCLSFLGLTQPANYKSKAQEFESLIHEHVSCTQLRTNSMLRHKLAIWCSWRPVGQKSAVVWKCLPWDSLLILLLFWLSFLTDFTLHEFAIFIVHQSCVHF